MGLQAYNPEKHGVYIPCTFMCFFLLVSNYQAHMLPELQTSIDCMQPSFFSRSMECFQGVLTTQKAAVLHSGKSLEES